MGDGTQNVRQTRRRVLQALGATGVALGASGAAGATDDLLAGREPADAIQEDGLPIDDRDLDIAVQAAERAAAIHDENFAQVEEAQEKAPQQLVTEVDTQSEAVIRETIRDELGDSFEEENYALFGEEGGGDLEGQRVWIIDPLDGTTNFVRGIPHFCVAISVTRGDEFHASVTYYSPRDEVYVAVRGEGAYRFVSGDDATVEPGTVTPISVAATDALEDSLNSIGLYGEAALADIGYLRLLQEFVANTLGIRQLGAAAVDMAFAAEGVFDTFTVKGLKPVDVAAGTLLVREAGGRVTDFDGNTGVDAVLEGDVIATNGELYDDVVGIMDD